MLCLQLQITLSLQYYLEVITVNIRSKALLLRAGLGGGGVGGGDQFKGAGKNFLG